MCKRSETITKLAAALVKFHSEVSRIEKDSTNPHYRNKYASLDGIIDEIRPILTKNGLAVIQMPGGDGEKFTMTTMLIHESGEWIESDPIVMHPVKNDPQGIGSCTTYARRYSLAAFLSLNTGEDDDGNGSSTTPQDVGQRKIEELKQKTQQNQASKPSQVNANVSLISEAQVKYCYRLKNDKGISDEDFKRMVAEHGDGNISIKELSKKAASEFITFLTNYQAEPVMPDGFPF